MALMPVKWNWEDALDKQLQKENDDKLFDIIHELLDHVFEAKNDILDLREEVEKLNTDMLDLYENQKDLNSKLQTVIEKVDKKK